MFITSIKFVQTIRAQVNLHRTNEKYQYQTLLLNAYQKNYIKLDPFLIQCKIVDDFVLSMHYAKKIQFLQSLYLLFS